MTSTPSNSREIRRISCVFALALLGGCSNGSGSGSSPAAASASSTPRTTTASANSRATPRTPSASGRRGTQSTPWQPLTVPSFNAYVLAVDPTVDAIVWAGGTGTLQLTTDGGASWTDMAPRLGFTSGIQSTTYTLSIAIDPNAPRTVYAFGFSITSAPNGGPVNTARIWKTTDEGATWTTLAPPFFHDVSSGFLAIDPVSSAVYVLDGGIAPQNNQLFRSSDGGATWASLPIGSLVGDVSAIAARASEVYVATVPSTPGGDAGLFKSSDSGQTWARLGQGFFDPATFATLGDHSHVIAIDPVTPSNVYVAGTSNASSTTGVVAKSTDGGATWSGLSVATSAEFFTAVLLDPKTPTTVYASGGRRTALPSNATLPVYLLKSLDGAATWQPANVGLPPTLLDGVPSLGIAASQPGTLYASYMASLNGPSLLNVTFTGGQ